MLPLPHAKKSREGLRNCDETAHTFAKGRLACRNPLARQASLRVHYHSEGLFRSIGHGGRSCYLCFAALTHVWHKQMHHSEITVVVPSGVRLSQIFSCLYDPWFRNMFLASFATTCRPKLQSTARVSKSQQPLCMGGCDALISVRDVDCISGPAVCQFSDPGLKSKQCRFKSWFLTVAAMVARQRHDMCRGDCRRAALPSSLGLNVETGGNNHIASSS